MLVESLTVNAAKASPEFYQLEIRYLTASSLTTLPGSKGLITGWKGIPYQTPLRPLTDRDLLSLCK